jgi:predicted transcriptional regulator
MSQSITINLPDDTKDALNSAATEEGLSESAFVEKAVTDYLFIRRFRSLRDRMMSQGKNLTDRDVFESCSGQ